MCGINGIFAYHPSAPGVDRPELLRTRDQMVARGPDGFGEWFSQDGRGGFGHRRLAIIDLSEAGAQPMATDDGLLHVTFNGEIYNYRDLRQELAMEGVRFRGHSDTEVLLHLYRRDGEQMVQRLRGMFAFAIWDEVKRALFLGRDRYGIKPLYYSDEGGVFRFASQVKALQAGGAVGTRLDPGGIAGFLLWGSIPEPFTVYQDIRALPAGYSMKVTQAGATAPHPYWDLSETIGRSLEAAGRVEVGREREHVRAALLDSVRAHMVADVPVGAFLSAGLDSGTVVGLAREAGSAALRTVTLAFDEFKGKPTDELPIASRIARHLGVEHRAVTTSMQEVEADLPAFFAAMDQPTIDGINTWFVAKAAAQAGLKVALSGLGGDELFGGYPSFADIPRRVASWKAPSQIPLLGDAFRAAYSALCAPFGSLDPRRAGLLKLGGSYEGAYQLQRGVFMPWDIGQIIDRDFAAQGLRRRREAEEERRALQRPLTGFAKVVELESSRYMRNQLLRDTDWVGMAHSLEIRVPLVDHVLLEKVVGLAALGRLGRAKSILPGTLSQPLPQEALKRSKTGFTVPIWKWLRKSPEFDAWKHAKVLRRCGVHDYNRWAYCILSRMPEARSVLK